MTKQFTRRTWAWMAGATFATAATVAPVVWASPASALSSNCGYVTCTVYFTRSDARVVAATWNFGSKLPTGWLPGGGVMKQLNRYYIDAANRAVAENACLKIKFLNTSTFVPLAASTYNGPDCHN